SNRTVVRIMSKHMPIDIRMSKSNNNTGIANPDGRALLGRIIDLYRQYLDCSSEQLDLLALWTMHTHIIPAAPFSPALNICSRQKHSGKTLCLQLLSLLCDGAWMHTAAAPTLLLHQRLCFSCLRRLLQFPANPLRPPRRLRRERQSPMDRHRRPAAFSPHYG